MYLMTNKADATGRAVYDYTEISPGQQERIQGLIESKKIPKTFMLGDKTIVSSEILGFTADAVNHSAAPKFQNFDEFREWAHKQKWYKRNAEREARRQVETSETSESLPQSSML